MDCDVPSMEAGVGTLLHNTFLRYLFAIATVASTFALRYVWPSRRFGSEKVTSWMFTMRLSWPTLEKKSATVW